MADDISVIGQVVLHAKLVVQHWHEFGPEADFDREIAALDAALQAWQRASREEETHG